ncbi:DUF397 domain-containing protein [Amycolatopsis cihanbeyliensis]|uniref:Uncharacterized protein DUF397 n=1 Tax=Amycolatopsis cihanbeyliensis TaxID=1128664 RepID=A0A542DEH5_AMYCI|nr:DUF397 domain-containing protein [Amycolatopsis cihanbeyliensis]TQJ01446.1 uncharacterized protein DUF397 [Amycolatopsis cihanbeyliensis]
MSRSDFTSVCWTKSSYSQGNGECIELARATDKIGVRDSKLGDASPVLTFTPVAITALFDALRETPTI